MKRRQVRRSRLHVLDDRSILRLWKEARGGDRESARFLLLAFCMSVENGEPVPRLLLGYLRSAFRRYLEDDTPIARALLFHPAHRPKGSHGKHTDPLHLAALFFLYRSRDRLPITKAKDRVADECNTTRRTVDKAVQENSDLVNLSDQELEGLTTPEFP